MGRDPRTRTRRRYAYVEGRIYGRFISYLTLRTICVSKIYKYYIPVILYRIHFLYANFVDNYLYLYLYSQNLGVICPIKYYNAMQLLKSERHIFNYEFKNSSNYLRFFTPGAILFFSFSRYIINRFSLWNFSRNQKEKVDFHPGTYSRIKLPLKFGIKKIHIYTYKFSRWNYSPTVLNTCRYLARFLAIN